MEFGFGVLIIALLVLWLALENKSRALELRLARIERVQQRLAEHQGVVLAGPELQPVLAQLTGIGRERNRIGAIKTYREITGADLAEAKSAVDRIDRGDPA